MVVHCFEITVPANTPQDNPIKVPVEIKEKVIHSLEIRIPPGHLGQTGLQIWYGLDQIWPKPSKVYGVPEEEIKPGWEKIDQLPDGTWVVLAREWFIGDSEVIDFTDYWQCPEVPCILTIKAYNLAEDFDHTFYIRIGALPKWLALPFLAIQKLVELLEKLLGV
jgi:hypothetical protein